MISSTASPNAWRSDAAAGEREVFTGWCRTLGIDNAFAATLASLATRDTYDGLLRYGGSASPFRGAEFSVRVGERERVAFAPRERAFVFDARAEQRAVVDAARAIAGADVLLGCGGEGRKLYLQRPHNLDAAAFRQAAIAWLRATGEAVEDDDALAFVCVDFARDGRMTPKVYRVTDDAHEARVWLGDSSLAAILDTLPPAHYVVTTRPGRRTLHARLFDDAPAFLNAQLRREFDQLQRSTRRRLVPTHLSWSEPEGAQTLYYMVDADV